MPEPRKLWSATFTCGGDKTKEPSFNGSDTDWLDRGAPDDRDPDSDADDRDDDGYLSEYAFYQNGRPSVSLCSEFLDDWFHGNFTAKGRGAEIDVEIWSAPVEDALPICVDHFARDVVEGRTDCCDYEYATPVCVYVGDKLNSTYNVGRSMAARLFKIICHDNNMHHAWLRILV